jgi:D-alanyl-D-alanine carboxypeptidase (penicillin-binding protein 5/6)
MSNSTFYSPHGLPPDVEQSPDMVSAEDFTTLSSALIKEFPEVLEYTKIKEMPFRDGSFIMRNHNKLLFNDESIDGLKTGFYNKAGFNITVSAKKDNIRLIAVLMGCPDRKERDQLASSLIKIVYWF